MTERPSLAELTAFLAIVRHQSFRAAADELGISPSSLSHLLRGMEERLGVRLFNRTTRSVATTDAGQQLARNVGPILAELDNALGDLGSLSGRTSGRLRINVSEIAAGELMRAIVPTFVERHPDVQLDLVTEGKLVDIVAEGFDAGVRLGEALPQDMVAVPFGGDVRFIVVASPDYLAKHGTPHTPDALAEHRCIRFRLPSGKMYRWEFERQRQSLKVDVPGSLTLDHIGLMVEAAAKGMGLAYVWSTKAEAEIDAGRLVTVLDDWTPPIPGHHLYYPSSRLMPAALRAFIEVIREVEAQRAPAKARVTATSALGKVKLKAKPLPKRGGRGASPKA
jgi:DNA-binding transcriptional LysR family regulator